MIAHAGSVSRRAAAVLVGVTTAIVVLVFLAASSASEPLWVTPTTVVDEGSSTVAPQPSVELSATERGPSADWPSIVGPVLFVVAVLVLIGIGLLGLIGLSELRRVSLLSAVRGRLRRRGSIDLVVPDAARVDLDRDALVGVLDSGVPRNAIVECWMLLESRAGDAGLERDAAETSSEWVERVVGESSVDDRPIRELAQLFREARFSSRPVTEQDRADAREAVVRVIDGLHEGERV